MEHSEVIGKFLSELERIILDYSGEIDHIVLNNMEYNLAIELLETLRNSPVDFAITYYNASSEMKKRIRNLIAKASQEEISVDKIINETLNLYFLNSQNLLDDDDIAPQRITAIETLEDLQRLLSTYVDGKEYISEEEIDKRKAKAGYIYALGSIFGNGEQSDAVEDIETLERVLNEVNLTDEEKIFLITSIIEKNVEFYEERIAERNRMIEEEIERNKQEVEEEIIEEETTTTRELTPEQADEIEKLLSTTSIVEKIVRVVNDDVNNTIRVKNPNPEEEEIIEESILLAREDIIERVLNEGLSPKEALEKFFEETDRTKETKNRMLHEILDGTEDIDISYEEQINIINEGIDFYRNNKKLIQTLSKQDREIISKYMFTIYKSKEQRRLLYQSKSYNDDSKILAEAAYEIQVLIGLLDSLNKESDEYKQMIKNASKRISDILECVKEFENTDTKEPEEDTSEGTLYYLMRNDNKAIIENDIRPDDMNKGISPEYYDEILYALNEIRNRSDSNLHLSIAPGDNYRYMRKNGVQLTYTGSRVQVLYIPVNKKDAIIVGVIFSEGKRSSYRDQEDRIRRYQGRIDDLKTEIANGNPILRESAVSVDERLKESLSQEGKKASIRQMLESDEEATTGKAKKK